jgi:hypothetical protein
VVREVLEKIQGDERMRVDLEKEAAAAQMFLDKTEVRRSEN